MVVRVRIHTADALCETGDFFFFLFFFRNSRRVCVYRHRFSPNARRVYKRLAARVRSRWTAVVRRQVLSDGTTTTDKRQSAVYFFFFASTLRIHN